MARSISIYVPDDLFDKMRELSEVNWSEVGRQAIEDYISKRERYDEIGMRIERNLRDAEYLTQKLHEGVREKELQHMQMTRSHEFTAKARLLRFRRDDQYVDIVFTLRNLSKEDFVVFDRLTFVVDLVGRDGSVIESVWSNCLRRVGLRPGQEFSGAIQKLSISDKTLERLNQMVSERKNHIKWNLIGSSYWDSSKGVIEGLLEDESNKSIEII